MPSRDKIHGIHTLASTLRGHTDPMSPLQKHTLVSRGKTE